MALCNLLPLLILLILVAILAFIGFVVWDIVQGVGAATRERMEKRHVLLSREGVTVGVRELTGEDYIDRSQRYCNFPFLQVFLSSIKNVCC